MNAKHTPGPWNTGQRGRMLNVGHNGTLIATIDCRSQHPAVEAEAHANARLIAAAPELLEALHSALNIEGAAILGAQSGAWTGLDVQYHFGKIRAAITKATTE